MAPMNRRILEIGDTYLFKLAYPNQTTFVWTGWRDPWPGKTDAVGTPGAMARLLADKSYDLIVVHPPLYSPAHPRYWGRSLFRKPFHPWSALTRGFGVSWPRFINLPAPLVVADFSDCPSIGSPMAALLDKADFAFKRELPTDRWRVLSGLAHRYLPTQRIRRDQTWARRINKLRPVNLPLFFLDETLAPATLPEKRFDLFFAGGVEGNSTVRADGLSELERLKSLGVTIDRPDKPLSQGEFLERMSLSWLAWSPEGLGWQCYRHAEAGLCQTVPVMSNPTILRATPMEEGVHAFYYAPEPGALTGAVLRALEDKKRLRRMAAAARDFSASHFTVKACAAHILGIVFGEAT